jgi:hypothetical protein
MLEFWNLKPRGGRFLVTDGRGLGLEVMPSGALSLPPFGALVASVKEANGGLSSGAAVPIEPRCTNLASKGGTRNKNKAALSRVPPFG